jgi:hypothetical protein
MPSLKEHIANNNLRATVIDDACRVLDHEVEQKSGLTGLAVKGAYKFVKSIKPGFIPEVVDSLLDEFLDALDPMYQEAVTQGKAPGPYLATDTSRMADCLLAVTDKRARVAKNAAIKAAYEKLRPMAKRHVEAAAPRVAELVARHAPSPA